MNELIIKNKEWIFSGIGVFIISSSIALIVWIILSSFKHIRQSRDKAEGRVDKFVNDFRSLYKNDEIKLEILIPAGINLLKNDKEIKLAFETLMKVIPKHPLRNWKAKVEETGYQRFFRYVANSGQPLNKYSIDIFLEECKNQSEIDDDKPHNFIKNILSKYRDITKASKPSFRTIWKGPVWSKIIATCILAMFGIVWVTINDNDTKNLKSNQTATVTENDIHDYQSFIIKKHLLPNTKKIPILDNNIYVGWYYSSFMVGGVNLKGIKIAGRSEEAEPLKLSGYQLKPGQEVNSKGYS